MILRFLEMGGEEGTVNVRIPLFNAAAAWTCNAMEQKTGALPVTPHGFSFPIRKFQIVTVRLNGSRQIEFSWTPRSVERTAGEVLQKPCVGRV